MGERGIGRVDVADAIDEAVVDIEADPDFTLRERVNKTVPGVLRVIGRRICADEVCDGKHPGFEDCVMARDADRRLRALLEGKRPESDGAHPVEITHGPLRGMSFVPPEEPR